MSIMKQKMLYMIVIIVILAVIFSVWFFTSSAGAFSIRQFGFSLTANPSSGSVIQGQATTSSIKTTLVSGKTQTVQLTTSGCPASTTCNLNPTSGNPTFSSTLTISTTSGTPLGTSIITIKGVGGGKTKTTTYTLTVNPVPCNCGSWMNGICGGNGCTATQRYQTRTCTPAGCNVESQCVSDPTCTNPDSCADSDGGLIWNVTGTVSGYKNNSPYSYTDFCPYNMTLVEHYCSGTTALNQTHSCPCLNGRCLY